MRSQLATFFCRSLSSIYQTIDTRIHPSAVGDRRLYLTFDDGPHGQGTDALLDVLARYHATATFFLVGESVRRRPDLVRRTLAAGHAVGNHSDTHIDGWKASRISTLRDYIRGSRALQEVTGQRPTRLRPPYGKVTRAVARWAKRNRQRLTLWDVMPPDFDPRSTVDSLARTLMKAVRPGSIICLHDNDISANHTPQLLERCLPRLQAAGWTFAALPR